MFYHRNYAIHKIALGSERITKTLVAYYYLIILNTHYPERWLKIVDIMLEKGEGPVLGKLRITQLVEVDFQLLMRIFLNERMAGVIETDDRML